MPARRPLVFNGVFIGLELENSEYAESPSKAIVADNVIVKSGRIERRPGRQELSEDQGTTSTALGVVNYTPPEQTVRSVVVVRADGIYQRAI